MSYHLMKLGSQVKNTYYSIQTNQVNSSHFSKILHYSSDYTKFSIYHHNKMKFFFIMRFFFGILDSNWIKRCISLNDVYFFKFYTNCWNQNLCSKNYPNNINNELTLNWIWRRWYEHRSHFIEFLSFSCSENWKEKNLFVL